MKNKRMKVLVCLLVCGFVFAFVALAADKPPTPVLAETINMGTHTAYIYEQGDNTLCITVMGKGPGPTPAGMCFSEARELLVSDPLKLDDGWVYAFTVDLIARPDPNCSISVALDNTGGAQMYCAGLF